jgi:hypothetical protein
MLHRDFSIPPFEGRKAVLPEFSKRKADIVSHVPKSPSDSPATQAKQRLQVHTKVVGSPFVASYDHRPSKNKSSYYEKEDVNRSSVIYQPII